MRQKGQRFSEAGVLCGVWLEGAVRCLHLLPGGSNRFGLRCRSSRSDRGTNHRPSLVVNDVPADLYELHSAPRDDGLLRGGGLSRRAGRRAGGRDRVPRRARETDRPRDARRTSSPAKGRQSLMAASTKGRLRLWAIVVQRPMNAPLRVCIGARSVLRAVSLASNLLSPQLPRGQSRCTATTLVRITSRPSTVRAKAKVFARDRKRRATLRLGR
jgi:hypothetical protein